MVVKVHESLPQNETLTGSLKNKRHGYDASVEARG
jgi:hypothetical protein